MSNSNLIKDNATRISVKDIEKVVNRIDNIRPLPADASLKQVIDTINKITNNLKRK